ncbi:hypothetical protein Y032_0130g1551 [Ancylostoma ceylanicum]|uniref:GST C-terminal domain-containing protein n=1 Tax=Ancylostoma ceylanicum TaxID=53326 RepID=A0A016T7F3_9BILA|nr:hypothetical protein Y032_0130g1551 [Ancylostoma ceylanicum]
MSLDDQAVRAAVETKPDTTNPKRLLGEVRPSGNLLRFNTLHEVYCSFLYAPSSKRVVLRAMSRLTLWVRAGSDGLRCGGDPAAHQLFMLMLWKAEKDPNLTFDVKTVNESRPPPEFREAGLRRAPALQISDDTAFNVEDEIMEELENYGPSRERASEAEDATADLFRTFAFYIKDIKKEPTALLGELQRIDQYLASRGRRFLAGDEPSHIDCVVLPRLHSIRIAAKALKEFDIPSEYSSLWAYMKNGYGLKSFTTSCPSDQEIHKECTVSSELTKRDHPLLVGSTRHPRPPVLKTISNSTSSAIVHAYRARGFGCFEMRSTPDDIRFGTAAIWGAPLEPSCI